MSSVCVCVCPSVIFFGGTRGKTGWYARSRPRTRAFVPLDIGLRDGQRARTTGDVSFAVLEV